MKENEYQIFRKALLDWFVENQRDLPWRRTYDPYHVWISEIMLQQTQMERVVEYFNQWIDLYPDIASIASASEQELLKAWEGLGYYSRARNLMKAAKIMVADHDGSIPDDYDRLLALPGIGPYTAAAVLSIAYKRPYPVVDANVERFFARLEDIDRPLKDKDVQKGIKRLAADLMPAREAREFNQALMELGALVCTPRNPDCANCPVLVHCRALQAGTVPLRPVVAGKQKKIDIDMACTIIIRDKKIFIQQRRYDDVWGGLWEFPGGRIKEGESPGETAARELYEETGFRAERLESFHTVTHFYTRYRVTLHSFITTIRQGYNKPQLNAALQYRWASFNELENYAFPAGHKQLIGKMKNMEAKSGGII